MKISFFCNEYPPRPHGGIGTFVYFFAQRLVSYGHEVTVIQWGSGNKIIQLDGVRLVTLSESKLLGVAWLINRLRFWVWLFSEAKANRIDLIEIPDYQGPLPFPFTLCPVVVRLHHSESHIRKVLGLKINRIFWLEKLTLYWHRNWIGVSHYIFDETRQFFNINPTTSLIAHNFASFIDESELPIPPYQPKKYVVCVGAVSERKGVLLLVKSMLDVFERHPDVYLVYVGQEAQYLGNPISQSIFDIAGEYKNRILLTGQVSHEMALKWICEASILAFVSRVESFGLVVVEAMAYGVPVVSSVCGPGHELVDQGIDGILINPDRVPELTEALLRLFNDPPYAASLGHAGKRKAKNLFTLTSCAEKSITYYEILLSQ